MTDSFDRIIQEHLDLKRRNNSLEGEMPLSDYLNQPESPQPDGVFDGAAFDTASGSQETEAKKRKPSDRSKAETFLESLEDVWSGAQSFDWGDDKAS